MTRRRLRAELSFAAALLATSVRATLALRAAFWLQAGFMVANNLLYFATWWIFFARFRDVGGWQLRDLAALFGVVAAGWGTAGVLAGGVRELARQITEGELDAFLTQPKSVLLQSVSARSRASGFGDVVSGLVLIYASGLVDLWSLPLVVVAVALSATTFLATGVILHASAFWLDRSESLAMSLWEFMIPFSSYPPTLFSGALRIVLFTVIPAGFIGFLPVGLLRAFSPGDLALACAGALAYAALAVGVFRRGLRHYESGSRWSVRA